MISLSPRDVTVIDDGVHMIRVALTPVFLLTGIGTLINIFSTRLALVATQVDKITESITKASASEKVMLSHRLDRLRQRSLALDVAVIFGAIGGTATCVAVLTLFYGALRNGMVESMLYASFALAINRGALRLHV